MIDFETEVLNRRKEINRKVEKYNSMIKENLEGIKNIFKEYDYSITTKFDEKGYIELVIKNKENHHVYKFNYIDGSIASPEERLKSFVTDVVIDNNITINEYYNGLKEGMTLRLTKDLKVDLNDKFILKGMKGEIFKINRTKDEISVALRDSSIVSGDTDYIASVFEILVQKI